MRAMFLLTMMAGCGAVTDEPTSSPTSPALTTPPPSSSTTSPTGTDLTSVPTTPGPVAVPDVWGSAPAEDHDPDPAVVEVHLTAAPTELDLVDGGATPMWAYNGQVPGPLLQARVGDLLRVVFTNELDEPTTIHWHGLRIDNLMDGVPAIQDPILPGETFTYEFVLPDAGTYWYHPHMRGHEQIERGLQGPLVVHEAVDPEVTRDRSFVLDDIALQSDGQHYDFNLSGMDGMHGRHGTYLLTNGSTEMVTGSIEPGAVERWRLVNTSNARLIHADVQGADWRVVGVDGGILEVPYDAKDVRLPVGRRFDLEVIPHADAESVQLEVLLPRVDFGFERYPVFEALVEGDPVESPVVEWVAAPLPAREPIEQEVVLELDAAPGFTSMKWLINGEQYGDGEPVPLQAHVPTRILISELSGAGHPFHLHGQFFEVVARNGDTDDIPGPLDTIHVAGRDELELYTTFDNPGLWMAHCHILEHAELGMMTSLDVTE